MFKLNISQYFRVKLMGSSHKSHQRRLIFCSVSERARITLVFGLDGRNETMFGLQITLLMIDYKIILITIVENQMEKINTA